MAADSIGPILDGVGAVLGGLGGFFGVKRARRRRETEGDADAADVAGAKADLQAAREIRAALDAVANQQLLNAWSERDQVAHDRDQWMRRAQACEERENRRPDAPAG